MNAIDTGSAGAGRFAVVLNTVEAVLRWLGALILAALLVLVLTAVTLRYVFGSGLIWSEELAIWLNVLLVAIGAPLAATSALAMRLDVVVRLLPASVQRLARLVADGIAIDAGLILALGGIDVVAAIGGTSTVLGLPEWLRYACVAAGVALTAFMLFGKRLVADVLARAATVLVIGLALYVASYHLHFAPLDTPSLAAGIAAAIGIVLGAPLPHTLLAGVALATPF